MSARHRDVTSRVLYERTTSLADLGRRAQAPPRRRSAPRCQTRRVDALLMQNNNDWLGGYVKWFTDLPAVNGYPRSIIFHAADPMTVVEMGYRRAADDRWGRSPVHRGVERDDLHAGLHLGRLYGRLPRRPHHRGAQAPHATAPSGLARRRRLRTASCRRSSRSSPAPPRSSTPPSSWTTSRRSRATRKSFSIRTAAEMQDEIFSRLLRRGEARHARHRDYRAGAIRRPPAQQRARSHPGQLRAARPALELHRPPPAGPRPEGGGALHHLDRE